MSILTRSVCIVLIWLLLGLWKGGESKSTKEQMDKAGAMMRSVCQPKFKVPDDVADNIKNGQFPEDKNAKCYYHCIFEMMQTLRKTKVNYESAMKQIDLLLPEEFIEPTKHALNMCKDSTAGIKDNCDAGLAYLKCFHQHNTNFFFP